MLILVPIHQIQGYPNGAPTSACGDMIPGHGVSAQQSTSPFMANVSNMVIIEFLSSDQLTIIY